MPVLYPRFVKLILSAMVAMALASCGKGGGSATGGTTIPGMTTANISGTVLNGTIVAVDASLNTEVQRQASSEFESGMKSFSMPLPIGKSYKFYLIENAGTAEERAYPIYQGSANRFSISSTIVIDFGFIDTKTGAAIPANDITDNNGIVGARDDNSVPATLAGSVFTSSDLQGDWQVLQLVSGSNPRWLRGTITMDSDGNASPASFTSSLGSETAAAAAYSITSSGVVTVPGGISNIFNGVMARDKSMIIGTSSPGGGNYALVIMLKSGTAYSATDLQGEWIYKQLVAGTSPAWARGVAGIDANGTISITNAASSASIGSVAPDTLSGDFTIDPSGVVTASALPAFYGVISAARDLLFAVTTDTDSSPSLIIFTRDDGTVFSGNELGNLWRANWLSSARGASATSYWGRAFLNGDSYLQSIVLSYGTIPDASITASLTSNGSVGIDNTNFSGIMARGGNFIVGTMTDGSNNFTLYTFIR